MKASSPTPSDRTLSSTVDDVDADADVISTRKNDLETQPSSQALTPILESSESVLLSDPNEGRKSRSIVSNPKKRSLEDDTSEGTGSTTTDIDKDKGAAEAPTSGNSGTSVLDGSSKGKARENLSEDTSEAPESAARRDDVPAAKKRRLDTDIPQIQTQSDLAQDAEMSALLGTEDVVPDALSYVVVAAETSTAVASNTGAQANSEQAWTSPPSSITRRRAREDDSSTTLPADVPPSKKPRLDEEERNHVVAAVNTVTSILSSESEPAAQQDQIPPGDDPAVPPKPSPILTLPLELLSEILILTGSPEHVLATARTCKALCLTLLSPNAQFIWREARNGSGCTFEVLTPPPIPSTVFGIQQVLPGPGVLVGGAMWILGGPIAPVVAQNAPGNATPPGTKKIVKLPDPPVQFFGEAAYAAFLFDSGECECCSKETSVMYASFALRARVCRSRKCSLLSKLTQVNNNPSKDPRLVAILPVNEMESFSSSAHHSEYLRDKDKEDYKKKYKILEARKKEWMELCVELHKWKSVRQQRYSRTKDANEKSGKKIASSYGWDYDDLLKCTPYGVYQSRKTKLMENVNEVDVKVMKEEIEAMLLAHSEKSERRNTEISLMHNRKDVEDVYNRLRSMKTHPYLPSLSTFRQLPVISMLQTTERAASTTSVSDTLQNNPVMKDLLSTQLKKWTDKAKIDLGIALGFPKNWKNANKNILHPVERVTARFLCMQCQRIDAKYRDDESLDFAGACRHECGVGNQKKGRIRKGKKAAWDATNFVKDEKAINVLKKCLSALEYAEDRDGGHYMLKSGIATVCTSCDPPMVMDTRNIIGHSHRHDVMEVSFASLDKISSHLGGYPYEYGVAQKLLGTATLTVKGRAEIDKKNYGCRHCLRTRQVTEAAAAAAADDGKADDNLPIDGSAAAEGSSTVPEVSSMGEVVKNIRIRVELSTVVHRMHDVGIEGPMERPPPLFSFNGMRSHLKSKHGIENIRDEDILCYRELLV
ncbi:hypothetical protein BDZ97DRAFT_1834304 [Flammula alnicola]|nr:hypothetical protein BDZ97DRAFT_1834304 [Flammula alnicola]